MLGTEFRGRYKSRVKLSRDKDQHPCPHMLIGPGSIKLSDRCGVCRSSRQTLLHRQSITNSLFLRRLFMFQNVNVLQKADRV